MKCNNCGKEIPDDSLFCEFCGAKVVRVETEQKPEDKGTLVNKNRFPLWAIIASAALFLLLIIIVSWNKIFGGIDYKYAEDNQILTNQTDFEETIFDVVEVSHEWVDMGLSVKWAAYNLGASCPEEYGDFFAWGETQPKDSYTRFNYSYNGDFYTIPPEYDAASVLWGKKWRIPTVDEWRELLDCCKWEIFSLNGVNGRLVTAPNGNSIFFPAAGSMDEEYGLLYQGKYGFYWTSSIDRMDTFPVVWYSHFEKNEWGNIFYVTSVYGYFGFSVRPVCQ